MVGAGERRGAGDWPLRQARAGGGGRIARARRVFRHWGLRASPFVLGALALCVVFAPWLAPYPPDEDQLWAVLAAPEGYPRCAEGQGTNKFAPCSVNGIPLGRDRDVYYFALGADWLGRDVLSRVVYGARTSVGLAAIALAIGAVMGAALGLMAGYNKGGWIDRGIMRVVDILSVPLFYILIVWFILMQIAVALLQVFGQSFAVIAFALSLGAWMSVTRQVREVAANFMTRHLPAAIVKAVMVGCVLQAGRVVVLESALAFFGAGVSSPTPSWGSDISAGMSYFGDAWWVVVFPAMAIALTALTFGFAGGWLRDMWDMRDTGGALEGLRGGRRVV